MKKSEIKIRRVRPSDAPSIRKLLQVLGYQSNLSATKKQIQAYSNKSSLAILPELNGEEAGFISFHLVPLFHMDGFLGRITALVVDKNFRRKGIALKLVRYIEVFGKKRGCRRFEVTTNEKRSDAHRFYAEMGYRKASRRYVKES